MMKNETQKPDSKKASMKALITTFYGVQRERIMAGNRAMSMRFDKLKCEECKHVIWVKEEKDREKIESHCLKCEEELTLVPRIPPLHLEELEAAIKAMRPMKSRPTGEEYERDLEEFEIFLGVG